jgi:prepilin-type N-terminal cleavage/methylation domain-containing protein
MICLAPWRNDRCADNGFTLPEVLVALVVLGLILAGLSTGFRFGQQALVAQSRDTAMENQVGPVDAAPRSLVAKAPGAADAEARFAGTARVLSFRTTMPESLTTQRIRGADVTIGVDPTHRLYLAWLPWYRNWIVAKPLPSRIDLLANVDHIEFAYRNHPAATSSRKSPQSPPSLGGLASSARLW